MIAQDLQSLQGGGDNSNRDGLGLKEMKKRSLLNAITKTSTTSSGIVSLPKIICIGAIVAAVAAVGIMTLRRSRR